MYQFDDSIGPFIKQAIEYYMSRRSSWNRNHCLYGASLFHLELWTKLYKFTAVYLLSRIFKKPLVLYFAVDFAYLQGFPRENSKHLYSIKENIKWVNLITALFVIQGLVMNSVMAILIMRPGVEAFMHLILLRKALGLIFGILIFVGYLFSWNKVTAYMQTYDITWSKKDSNHPNAGLEEAH